jgi:hypothetical protein
LLDETSEDAMRTLAWLAGALAAVILLLWGSMLLLAEYGGEIVDLRTVDASGETSETRLWVVDDSGSTWLWAAAPGRRWLQRLRTHPEVQIVRGGEVARYRAVPVETDEARQRIGCLTVWRYGAAAHALQLIHHVVLRHAQSEAVPIRLEPARNEAENAAAAPSPGQMRRAAVAGRRLISGCS